LQQCAHAGDLVGQSPVGVPHGDRTHPTVNSPKHGDLGETPSSARIPGNVQQHLSPLSGVKSQIVNK
jgi:hypothetical protein